MDLLQGKGIYQCPPHKYLPAYIPTDFKSVLYQGIYSYYTNTKDEKIVNELEEAIKELCNGDAVQIWIAYTCHWFLVRSKIGDKLPFKYHDKEVGAVIESAVISHEKELKNCKEWNGWDNEEGLWQEIKRTNGVLRKNYNYTIIKNISFDIKLDAADSWTLSKTAAVFAFIIYEVVIYFINKIGK